MGILLNAKDMAERGDSVCVMPPSVRVMPALELVVLSAGCRRRVRRLGLEVDKIRVTASQSHPFEYTGTQQNA